MAFGSRFGISDVTDDFSEDTSDSDSSAGAFGVNDGISEDTDDFSDGTSDSDEGVLAFGSRVGISDVTDDFSEDTSDSDSSVGAFGVNDGISDVTDDFSEDTSDSDSSTGAFGVNDGISDVTDDFSDGTSDSDLFEDIDSSSLEIPNDSRFFGDDFSDGIDDFSDGIDDFSEDTSDSELLNPLGTVTPLYVFFLDASDASLEIEDSESCCPPSKSIPNPFLWLPPSKLSSSSSSSKNKLKAPFGLLESIFLYFVYSTSSSSGSIDGTSELVADSSVDEIISSITDSSFSPEEHN